MALDDLNYYGNGSWAQSGRLGKSARSRSRTNDTAKLI
jgi:hypothetical protein